jgi:hypothetical protein
MSKDYMMNATEVATLLHVSKGHAYKLIQKMNDELEANGYIVVAGKIPRPMWERKFFHEGSKLEVLKGVC